MTRLRQDLVFTALTRPQMFAGVSYSWFVVNGIIAAELFLIFRSMWVVPFALLVHIVGVLMALKEPRFLDLWLIKASRCPRIRNYALWGCNSYRP